MGKQDNNTDQIFEALRLHYSEWQHRDNLFWKQAFTFFYATLIVILFPYIRETDYNKIKISSILFQIVGFCMALFFLFVIGAYAKRLDAINETCRLLRLKLPKELRRMDMKFNYEKEGGENRSTKYRFTMVRIIVYTMFGSLIALAVILIMINVFIT